MIVQPLARIVRSFRFAGEGVAYLLRTQPNFWVHCSAAVVVMVFIIALRAPAVEAAVLILAIGLVLACEAFNSAIEAVVDLVSPECQPRAKIAKDTAAAAVLLVSCATAVVGLLVLGPRLLTRLLP